MTSLDAYDPQPCDAHLRMVDAHEKNTLELGKMSIQLKAFYWLAGAVFVVGLGSIGALLSISYQSGSIVQMVQSNARQIEKVTNIVERHIERH